MKMREENINTFLEYTLKNFETVSMYRSGVRDVIDVYLGRTVITLPELIRLENEFEVDVTFEVNEGDKKGEYGVIDIEIILPFKILGKKIVITTWVENNNNFQPIKVFKEYEDYIRENTDKLNVKFI
jgi:hypothetical protein